MNDRSSPDIGQALSPCPFCGGRANVYVNEIDFVTKWSVGCGDCDCNMDVCEDTPADAAVEWNTRAPSSAGSESIANAIREHFKSIGNATVYSSDGIERIYYSGFSLNKLAEAITHAITGGVAQRGREPGFVKPDNDRQVFFYEQDFYVLSNFSAFQVRSYGIDFATSEHLYHWEKFNGEASHQPEIQREIRFSRSAHDAFKIAEKYKASRRVDWDQVKVNVMANILRAKVQQHEYVRRKLLATGDRELIEDSWRDDFWGWGPNRDGRNELGKLWMDIRAELRASTLSSTNCAGGK